MATGEMAERSAVELLRAWLEGLERLDVDGCLALMADDAVLLAPFAPEGLAPRYEGRAAYEPPLRMVGGLFRSLAWVEREVHATDDPELAVGIASARIVLAGGGDYSQDYVIFVRAREGEIIEYREYLDPVRAQQALAGAG